MCALKKLETPGAKFESVDTKKAFKYAPALIKRTVEVYNAYNSHLAGNEAARPKGQEEETGVNLKVGMYHAHSLTSD